MTLTFFILPGRLTPLLPTAEAAAGDLFISEYIEGSSFNKALEIYNGTGASVDLGTGGYRLELYSNGATGPSQSVGLTGTIAAGDVFVIAHASANAAILAQADTTNSSVINHNGDDAFVLRKGGVGGPVVDVIGQVGFDPGTEWGSGLTSTADNTIRRKPTVCAGDTNPSDPFDPAAEWDGFAVDTFDGFGTHTADCGGPPSLLINDVTVPEGDSGTTTAEFTVSLSSPAPGGGVTFDIATSDDTATAADNDYVAQALTAQTIPAGQQTYSFSVTINGDTKPEPNETFFVNVTNVTGANVSDGQGLGTITTDDIAPSDVLISQVYGGGGNAGATFTHDFIELFNRGATPVSLAGWSVQYTSAAGTTWQVTPLTGSIAPGGYYLVQQAAGTGGTVALPTPDASGSIAMSATAGKVALRNSTAAITGACPSDATIVDLVGFGSTTCHEGAGPTAATSNTTAALRKRGGCHDSNNNNLDFSAGSPNPRNSATPTRSCGYTPAAIHDIQGAGLTTPFLGQDVSTTGVVTGVKSNGFFLQTPDADADADPATSQAIFVFTSSAPAVAVGDGVMANGTATEFFNLTQLESTLVGDVTVTSAGNSLPAPVTLTTSILNPAGPLTQLERFEGMRVHADALRSVAPTNNFGEIFTVLDGVARPLREPGIEISNPVPPDPTSLVPDCCIPRWDENPERIMVDTDGLAGSAVVNVTSNVTLSGVTGPLDFTFSNYKVLPETPPATTDNMSATPVPAPAAGEFTVAGYNIENFNSNNAAQLAKTALAIRTVMRSPDVIGHIEIANLSSLEALAARVNSDAVAAGEPNPMYVARLIPAGLGTQHLGFLVKTSRVRIDSVTQERADETFEVPGGGTAILHDRPPLVLRATVGYTGDDPRPIIVIVNHLRSFIDIELVGGEGPRVRAKRTKQAESLAGLLQELQTTHPTTPIISVGDYNAFQFNDGYTDPISVIKGMPTADDQVVVDESPDLVNPDFINLTDKLPVSERYTFIFEGTPQALDHVLVNKAADSILTGYHIARNNSDFPEAAPFTGTARPEANSDHDMPVAYFAFPKRVTTTEVVDASVTYEADGQNVTLTAHVSAPGELNETVGEGAVSFTVTTSDGATTVGAAGPAAVSGGIATASFFLPGSVLPQTLKVTASFSGGDTTLPSTDMGTLTVRYAVCTLYDSSKAVKSGGVYPIRIQLCDASGTNVSAPDTVVTTLHVALISALDTTLEMEDAGNANPDAVFRYDAALAGYVFNLKTTGLAPGVYNLYFKAGDDPTAHAVEFRVK